MSGLAWQKSMCEMHALRGAHTWRCVHAMAKTQEGVKPYVSLFCMRSMRLLSYANTRMPRAKDWMKLGTQPSLSAKCSCIF